MLMPSAPSQIFSCMSRGQSQCYRPSLTRTTRSTSRLTRCSSCSPSAWFSTPSVLTRACTPPSGRRTMLTRSTRCREESWQSLRLEISDLKIAYKFIIIRLPTRFRAPSSCPLSPQHMMQLTLMLMLFTRNLSGCS